VVTLDVDLVQEMTRAIVREAAPQQVIVLGSWARGTAGPDADLDFLVVEATPFGHGKDRRREMVRIWRALAHFAVPKDILVYSRDEVEHWRGARNHIVGKALREGQIVYGLSCQ
jgi:uncharacterized protein